ncbi:hypothetical protein JCGZ_11603 [Jatropha curcas]|uniref:Aldose 1-epimerase n=1 Tax=Jatropha curcas TaxID=180498 RepID=A0A067K559_JATCU|nr:hypothetical protein JCGZ_11603 [Jatropha curcas]
MAWRSSFCCFLLVALLFSNNNGCEAADSSENKAEIYELKRGNFSVKFTNFGATMLSIVLPDKNGLHFSLSLGFNDTTYFGSIVGRVANRIGKSQFTLNGTVYKLVPNNGKNSLHGGPKGFSEVLWKVYSYNKDSHITFTYDSFDGEEGYPGDLSVSVTYFVIGTNKIAVKMVAKPLNKATPVNLALHTYFNLAGHNSGDILSHKIQLFAPEITPVDSELIPTGKITPVKGTPFDFLEPREIGSRIKEVPGYDINYVLEDLKSGHLKRAAIVKEDVSGRKLELWTNQPGVQFYTSNMLHDVKGKDGFIYQKFAGFCLETQGFPDSVNHPNFPSQIVNPGETYMHIMVYRFTAS